jgi:hypothetical protein
MTRVVTGVLALLLLTNRLEAQGPVVKYGKWLVLAGAIAMNYQAAQAHNQADDNFNALEARCFVDQQRCALGPDRTYLDPQSEELYQTTLHYDRVARGWLVAGATAVAATAGLFIWELTQPKGRPKNIPFEPEIRSLPGGPGVGLRLDF